MKNFDDRRQRWEAARQKWETRWQERRKRDRNGKIWFGALLFIIGATVLLQRTAVLTLPAWVISWPMLFIVIGLFNLIRSGFREGGWLMFMLLGGVFLAGKIAPSLNMRTYIWPVLFMIFGLWIIFKPRRKSRWGDCGGLMSDGDDEPEIVDQQAETVEPESTATASADSTENREQKKGRTGGAFKEDYADFTSVFGGVEKNIFSKNFRGGDIVNIFGGTSLNLSQADIQGTAVLEMTQVFGGTSLVIPPDWEVKSEMTAIFGGMEDKRDTRHEPNAEKTLIIKGTSIFGGIELKNF